MLIEHVRYMADEIGPRPSATPVERLAADYVANRLGELGYETRIDEFPALKTYSWLHFTHYMLFIAAWGLYFVAPWASVALAAAGLAGYAAEVSSFELLSRVFPKSAGSNAVGVRSPAAPAKAKVIVAAHVDSSRSALFFHPALVKGFRKTFALTVSAMVVTLAGAAVFAVGARPLWLWIAAGVLNLNLAVAALMLVDRELRGRHTAGAIDNASGVAAMLGAAEELAGYELKNIELEFVGTGSEETGLFGMIHHLEKNWHDRSNTYVINIDHVGIGNVVVTSREGMLLRRDSDARLRGYARGFALPAAGAAAAEHDFKTMLTDGYAALVRGFAAASIMAFEPDGTLANWHWHTDVSEPIREENLGDAAALAAHIARCIDEAYS